MPDRRSDAGGRSIGVFDDRTCRQRSWGLRAFAMLMARQVHPDPFRIQGLFQTNLEEAA